MKSVCRLGEPEGRGNGRTVNILISQYYAIRDCSLKSVYMLMPGKVGDFSHFPRHNYNVY